MLTFIEYIKENTTLKTREDQARSAERHLDRLTARQMSKLSKQLTPQQMQDPEIRAEMETGLGALRYRPETLGPSRGSAAFSRIRKARNRLDQKMGKYADAAIPASHRDMRVAARMNPDNL
jgi:hypothetical protein